MKVQSILREMFEKNGPYYMKALCRHDKTRGCLLEPRQRRCWEEAKKRLCQRKEVLRTEPGFVHSPCVRALLSCGHVVVRLVKHDQKISPKWMRCEVCNDLARLELGVREAVRVPHVLDGR